MPIEIRLPYNWTPREYQMPLWLALEGGCKRAICIWHRRAGKDLVAINAIVKAAMQRVGAYWHVFPTYKQGRKIAWEGKTRDGRSFLDHFPAELVVRKREQEMTIDFVNGSSYHIIGADNPDSQVGTNPVGLVISEWALYPNEEIWGKLQPILAENGGWAIFITTPRGRNHAYRMLRRAQADPKWFAEVLPYQKTGAITKEQVDEAIREGMSKDLAAQEFECSFDAALEHAYWGDELRIAAQENRIGNFPMDPSLPVSTCWDLGMDDATGIWWFQMSFGQRRWLHYDYASGQSLGAYVAMLEEFAGKTKGLVYKEHFFPHDVEVRDLGTGFTRKKTLIDLGLRNIRVVPKAHVQDRISAVRAALATSFFHEDGCEFGLEGLRQYSRMPLDGQFDPQGNQMYGQDPKHDWTSHPADAFGTGVMGARVPRHQSAEANTLASEMAIC